MSNLEPKTLVATKHDDMFRYRKVFNLTEIDYYLYVKLEPPLASIWYLYKVEEKMKDGSLVELQISSGEVVRQSPTWLKFQTNFIDTSVGLHVYKFTFVHTITNVVATLWFSYTIQNDNPDKPYIYMKRDELLPEDSSDDESDDFFSDEDFDEIDETFSSSVSATDEEAKVLDATSALQAASVSEKESTEDPQALGLSDEEKAILSSKDDD